MKIAVLTDSVSYLPENEIKSLNVFITPLSIEYNGKIYVEGKDLTSTEFYNLVRGGKSLPKSSQPVIGETIALLEDISKEFDAVIAITLSSEISGTFQTIQSLDGEVNGLKVIAIDSRRAAFAQSFLVRRAVKLINENYPLEKIQKNLEEMISKQNAFFIVDDLNHLQKGGRLSASSAFIGSMLNIKPILTIDGKITPIEKVRSFKKGINRVQSLVLEHVSTHENIQFSAAIHHANCLDVAEQIKSNYSTAFPNINFEIIEFGQTLGTHLGEGAIGVLISPTP